MSDARLRELERAWKCGNTIPDWKAWVNERVRRGLIQGCCVWLDPMPLEKFRDDHVSVLLSGTLLFHGKLEHEAESDLVEVYRFGRQLVLLVKLEVRSGGLLQTVLVRPGERMTFVQTITHANRHKLPFGG